MRPVWLVLSTLLLLLQVTHGHTTREPPLHFPQEEGKRIYLDCRDDYSWHAYGNHQVWQSSAEFASDIISIDAVEMVVGGEDLVVLFLAWSERDPPEYELDPNPNPNERAQRNVLEWTAGGQARSLMLQSEDDVTYTIIEGAPPTHFQKQTVHEAIGQGGADVTRIGYDIGYTYDQLQAKKGDTIRVTSWTSWYNDADEGTGGQWIEGDHGDRCDNELGDPIDLRDEPMALDPRPPTVTIAAPEEVAYDEAVTFTADVTPGAGNITQTTWDLGDGTTATGAQVTHTYGKGGTFVAILTVTDHLGSTATASSTIEVINQAPVTDFTFAPSAPIIGEEVTFTDASTDPDGEIVAWRWQFGDGSISDNQHPVHTYTVAEVRTVVLTTTDNVGTSASRQAKIQVRASTAEAIQEFGQGPLADFSYSGTLAPGQDIRFQDTSSDPDDDIASWAWEFGDGDRGTEQNPVHRYDREDHFNVTLIVTDADGLTSQKTRTLPIRLDNLQEGEVAAGKPVADYAFEAVSGSDGLQYRFEDRSTSPLSTITTWAWAFGDGTTSSEQNPTHTFTTFGRYTVRLVVTDALGQKDASFQLLNVVPVEEEGETTPAAPPWPLLVLLAALLMQRRR